MIEVEEYKGREEIAPALYAILADVYTVSPWTVEQIAIDIMRPETYYYLAKEGQNLLGFLAVQQLVDELEILHIAVRTVVQGQGIAGRLLECIELFSGAVFLEVRASNQRAKRLYERYGFVEIARRKDYYPNPTEDAIMMKREIDER
ncbi:MULTISPECIES: ribosomal protein S18-alanine N-acetyltransferase [unclassified Streptococcus]|uniref:ribosomal protein S18-alanine N-acetyltransferase n=1 Tax=unclassified Streptococcus TaxID=2608887 RepID=UPI0010725BCD|nr:MULTISPECIES: ribosomal protein S18-alanine N-acetyltransferase [unclassified Streptococcus]MBF0788065.1 ribosomal protein S18-alanine N-acetyltransferase [Streptococcus sp. 19428wC2_LYSM12]MCQ9211385.1 ribosomal protein S18-alanine N-acetyltransferase [Streptococcus sp. B01]MCQ9214697.1 ribosomal protein S18-alanine N-acetyltransferase [Streptococcus sp. O1]TFV04878.1 ribosomal-protein-alanine N-acetyltransferase [Streptococcus sp. LYSM12]